MNSEFFSLLDATKIIVGVLFVIVIVISFYFFKSLSSVKSELATLKPSGSDNSEIINMIATNKDAISKVTLKLDDFIKFVLAQFQRDQDQYQDQNQGQNQGQRQQRTQTKSKRIIEDDDEEDDIIIS
jgi:hypothetical protein